MNRPSSDELSFCLLHMRERRRYHYDILIPSQYLFVPTDNYTDIDFIKEYRKFIMFSMSGYLADTPSEDYDQAYRYAIDAAKVCLMGRFKEIAEAIERENN